MANDPTETVSAEERLEKARQAGRYAIVQCAHVPHKPETLDKRVFDAFDTVQAAARAPVVIEVVYEMGLREAAEAERDRLADLARAMTLVLEQLPTFGPGNPLSEKTWEFLSRPEGEVERQ